MSSVEISWCDVGNGFSFGGSVNCGDRCLRSDTLQLVQQMRRHRSAARENPCEIWQCRLVFNAILHQSLKKSRRCGGTCHLVGLYLVYHPGGINRIGASQVHIGDQTGDSGCEIGKDKDGLCGQVDFAGFQY